MLIEERKWGYIKCPLKIIESGKRSERKKKLPTIRTVSRKQS